MILALATIAQAGVDAHGFELLGTSGPFTRVATWAPAPMVVSTVFDYGANPMIEQLPTGNEAIVGGVIGGQLSAAASAEPFTIDATLPIAMTSGRQGALVGPGDFRLGLAAGSRVGGVDIAAHPAFWLPTGRSGAHLGGSTFSAGGVVSASMHRAKWAWAVNAGARLGSREVERNLRLGHGPLFGLAGARRVGPFWLSAELTAQGNTGFRRPPIEMLLGARFRSVSLMMGGGLNSGVGATSLRAVLSTRWGNRPDPAEPLIIPEEIVVAEVEPPDEDAVEEEAVDEGTDEQPLAELVDTRIVVRENVFFREGSDILLDSSGPLLDAVADVLKAHPEVQHLLIEGHTNHNGGRDFNLALSYARAEMVVDALRVRGIDPVRLVPKGYGFDRPLVPTDHVDARRLNRRVEFTVLRPDELPEEVRLPGESELPED